MELLDVIYAHKRKNDVVQIRKNWFTSINVCDSCGSIVFKTFKSDINGRYNEADKHELEGDCYD